MSDHSQNLNLEYLSEGTIGNKDIQGQEVGVLSTYYSKTNASNGANTKPNLQNLYTLEVVKIEPVEHKKVKIKTNFAHSQVLVLGSLILSFDKNGICELEEYKLPEFRKVQRAKPGRFTIVEEPKVSEPEIEIKQAPTTDEVLSYTDVINMGEKEPEVLLDDNSIIEDLDTPVESTKPRKKYKKRK